MEQLTQMSPPPFQLPSRIQLMVLQSTTPPTKFIISNNDGTPLSATVTSSFLVDDPSDPSADPSQVDPVVVDGNLNMLFQLRAPGLSLPQGTLHLRLSQGLAGAGDYTVRLSLLDQSASPAIETGSASGGA